MAIGEFDDINGITKREESARWVQYWFPLAVVWVFRNEGGANLGVIEIVHLNSIKIARFDFDDLPASEKAAFANAEEYIDGKANDGITWRAAITGGGGGGPSANVNIVGSNPQLNLETTQLEVLEEVKRGATSTVVSFNSSNTVQNILTAQTSRKEYKVYNKTSQELYLKEGLNVSSIDFTVLVPVNGFYSNPSYSGAVSVVQSIVGSGIIQVTEITI